MTSATKKNVKLDAPVVPVKTARPGIAVAVCDAMNDDTVCRHFTTLREWAGDLPMPLALRAVFRHWEQMADESRIEAATDALGLNDDIYNEGRNR